MFEFRLPDLGEGITEGQIVNVLVQEGDAIAAYAPMLEVETDKAAVEIPAPKAGRIHQVHVAKGQVVRVGDVLITIDESAAGATAAAPAITKETVAAAAATAPRARETAAAHTAAGREEVVRHESAVTVVVEPAARSGPVPAAPVVRKLARELGVDLARVAGSGPGGRVLREDVEHAARGQRGPAAGKPAPAGTPVAPLPDFELPVEPLPDFAQYGRVRREPVTQIRKTIARQMTRAWLNVPRVTHCDSADLTELERNRKRFNQGLKPDQPKLTMTAIVMKAVALALREYPLLNCSFDPGANEIIHKDYVHIGVAVDTPRGLVVPVLRDADRKTLPEIARELNDLAERARAVKFDLAELRGGTFTITNVGALGGTFNTPMVNFPEVGILGLGRAAWQAMVVDGQIVPRFMLPLSLSFDHRVVDGADAARFTRHVIESLENPLRLIILA